MPRHAAVRRAVALAVIVPLGAGALGACSKTATTAATTTTTVSPADLRTEMSDLIVKLRQMVVLGNRAASDGQIGAFDDAHARTVTILDLLAPVEATVKAASPQTDADIRSALALIRDGAQHHDITLLQQGAARQSAAVDAFAAAHG